MPKYWCDDSKFDIDPGECLLLVFVRGHHWSKRYGSKAGFITEVVLIFYHDVAGTFLGVVFVVISEKQEMFQHL